MLPDSQTDGQTDERQNVMIRKAHLNFKLRWAKTVYIDQNLIFSFKLRNDNEKKIGKYITTTMVDYYGITIHVNSLRTFLNITGKWDWATLRRGFYKTINK